MGFYWKDKKDQLFARRGTLPESSSWTSFEMRDESKRKSREESGEDMWEQFKSKLYKYHLNGRSSALFPFGIWALGSYSMKHLQLTGATTFVSDSSVRNKLS